MVLVNRAHWTERLPAWPVLRSLARGRSMESRIALVDSVVEVPDALAELSAWRQRQRPCRNARLAVGAGPTPALPTHA